MWWIKHNTIKNIYKKKNKKKHHCNHNMEEKRKSLKKIEMYV